jgi:hypothetical protein
MQTDTQTDVNVLLTQAHNFRSAATATALPDYRIKMLRAARHLEAQATQIEITSSRMAAGYRRLV